MTHPDDEWNEAAPYSWPDDPDPEDYQLMDYEPELEFDLDEWKRGRCLNCGAWAVQIAEGEYECCECGDIWNIYEMPEVP